MSCLQKQLCDLRPALLLLHIALRCGLLVGLRLLWPLAASPPPALTGCCCLLLERHRLS